MESHTLLYVLGKSFVDACSCAACGFCVVLVSSLFVVLIPILFISFIALAKDRFDLFGFLIYICVELTVLIL